MKKVLSVLLSVVGFFLLFFLIVPYLIDFGLSKKTNHQNENTELKEILKKTNEYENTLEKALIKEFLNKDNLYENYSHNYTIKIPENFKQNNGIGKNSSTQFYNEDLGFVVAISVGKTDLKKNIIRKQNNKIIQTFSNELEKDIMLKKMFEEPFEERGFNKIKLYNNKVTNYNNRMFLEMNFNANRISNNKEYPVLIKDYMTFHKDLAYHFQFVSYKKESSEKWNIEIQKSMSNVIISEYIKEKN